MFPPLARVRNLLLWTSLWLLSLLLPAAGMLVAFLQLTGCCGLGEKSERGEELGWNDGHHVRSVDQKFLFRLFFGLVSTAFSLFLCFLLFLWRF